MPGLLYALCIEERTIATRCFRSVVPRQHFVRRNCTLCVAAVQCCLVGSASSGPRYSSLRSKSNVELRNLKGRAGRVTGVRQLEILYRMTGRTCSASVSCKVLAGTGSLTTPGITDQGSLPACTAVNWSNTGIVEQRSSHSPHPFQFTLSFFNSFAFESCAL